MSEVKYLLVIKDDLPSYVWLRQAVTTNEATASGELAHWVRTFSAMEVWISYPGSHLKTSIMESLAKDYSIKHQLVVAYSPWANETVEVVNKHFMAACRAMTTELNLGLHELPQLIPLIQTALNKTYLYRLGRREKAKRNFSCHAFRTILEVMTSIQSRRCILVDTVPMYDGATRLTFCRYLPILVFILLTII